MFGIGKPPTILGNQLNLISACIVHKAFNWLINDGVTIVRINILSLCNKVEPHFRLK